MRLAFIGLGAMGRGMATTLLSAGHQVAGFDLDPVALEQLEEAGGTRAASAAATCGGADAAARYRRCSGIYRGPPQLSRITSFGSRVRCSGAMPGSAMRRNSSSAAIRPIFAGLSSTVVSAG